MKISGIQTIVALAAATVDATCQSIGGDHSHSSKDLTPVIVYVLQASPWLSALDVAGAETQASQMFLTAGAGIVWRHREPSALEVEREHAIVLQIALDNPASQQKRAFAFALPYEGVHVQVFYDRVRSVRPNATGAILAHVFVHEITHILQGINRHSEAGVMKPYWSAQDYDEMRRRPLPFTPFDIELIREGLAKRR